MNINQKAKEFATYVRNSDEFKAMAKSKLELEKNRTLKKQLDNYLNKKSSIYSNYRMEDAAKMMVKLNTEYEDFFNLPLVYKYMLATKDFNSLMEGLYKTIEKELIKK